MRIIKTCLLTAALAALSTASAQAQYWGGTTVVTRGPGVVVGPTYAPVVANPYVVPSTVVVRRPAVYAAPTVVASPVVASPVIASPVIAAPMVATPGPVLMSPGVTVVRPGWGWGPGPRPWGWRRW
ncbi:hypothetical protein [Paludisphaera rhizosphaerae]|uniref:hypothetical protein n=1 Tax=Paludisphaera rhizosphaerae TaxID=2711216 RepID=UPI0013EDC592|nr:hypothetical protein [Paludisphaera rhizosphaerae]